MEKQFNSEYNQVLVAHLFVAGSLRTESETEVMVGGLDQVSASIFNAFDYVALGHLHDPNATRHAKLQYSGTLLKFSISEANQQKGFKLIELSDEGELTNQFFPVSPEKELRVLEGFFADLIEPTYYEAQKRDDFIYVQLKDTKMIPDAMNRLREIYPNVLGMERLDRSGLMATMNLTTREKLKTKDPSELFKDYYEEVMGEALSSKQETLLNELLQNLDVTNKGGRN